MTEFLRVESSRLPHQQPVQVGIPRGISWQLSQCRLQCSQRFQFQHRSSNYLAHWPESSRSEPAIPAICTTSKTGTWSASPSSSSSKLLRTSWQWPSQRPNCGLAIDVYWNIKGRRCHCWPNTHVSSWTPRIVVALRQTTRIFDICGCWDANGRRAVRVHVCILQVHEGLCGRQQFVSAMRNSSTRRSNLNC